MNLFLGPAGIPIGATGSVIDGIVYVRKIGLNAMEVEFVHGVNMGNETAKKAGIAAKESNVRLSVHAPYYINLCNPEKKKDSEKRILDSCERAFHLNASTVVFHAGFYGKLSRKTAFDMVVESCMRMEDYLKTRGSNVLLGIETTGKKSQFGELSEIVDVCRIAKGCVPVIDFSHIYARNGGFLDVDELFGLVRKINPSHVHCHFSGIEFTPAGERRHLPIAEGGPDFQGIADGILKSRIDTTVICESPLLEKDALAMKKIFEGKGYEFPKNQKGI